MTPDPIKGKKGKGLIAAQKKATRLDFDQINEWNQFASNASAPGVSVDAMYNHYVKGNPGTSISLPALKNELALASQHAKNQAEKKSLMNPEEANVGNKFPTMSFNGKDYGPVNGDFQTREPIPAKQGPGPRTIPASAIPHYVKDLQWDKETNLAYYVDEKTGDTQYVEQGALNASRFRKSTPQQAKDVASRNAGSSNG
jgi:hypothetical protein